MNQLFVVLYGNHFSKWGTIILTAVDADAAKAQASAILEDHQNSQQIREVKQASHVFALDKDITIEQAEAAAAGKQ